MTTSDEHNIKERYFEDLIRCACEAEVQRMSDELPSEEELAGEISFSPVFEAEMARLFRDTRKMRQQEEWKAGKRSTPHKIAVAVVAALLLLTGVASQVEAVRLAVFNVRTNVQEDHTDYRFEEVNPETQLPSTAPDDWRGAYWPSYVPVGYELVSYEKADDTFAIEYSNGETQINFLQAKVSSGLSISLDNENVVESTIMIDKIEVLVLEQENEFGHFVQCLWQKGGYMFSLFASLNREDAIKFIEQLEYQS